MKPFYPFLLATVSCVFLAIPSRAQISLSSFNDFEDGSLMSWEVGAGIDPVNIPTDGPAGVNDNFLQLTADGSSSNGKLVAFNINAVWTGDWTAAGVTFISFMARNPNAVDNLTIRVNVDGAGGRFSSTTGILLPANSGWVRLNFAVTAADFTSAGGFNIVSTLSAVNTFRIIHNPSPSWQGVNVVGNLDMDVISAQNGALPISLDQFTVTADKFKNNINWKTLTESNSSFFEVERSLNGNTWEMLEKVTAAGNSSSPVFYQVSDLHPHKGISYYRLKLVDAGNHHKYSQVRAVTFNGEVRNNLLLYPNPATSLLTLAEKLPVDLSSVNITNLSGQSVSGRVKITKLSAYKIQVDISALPGGLYYIKTAGGTGSFFVSRE